MVEIEIGVLKRQCLNRRIDDREELEREIADWERQRNLAGAHLKFMFTTEKARTKMGRAYPRPAATLTDRPPMSGPARTSPAASLSRQHWGLARRQESRHRAIAVRNRPAV